MIGNASASCFAITGSSTSSGRRPRTRDTLSLTSCAAASISRSRLNSRVIVLTCSWLALVIARNPSTLDSSSSRTSVTADSTTCGLAPGRRTVTDTIGGSASGNSRTGNRVYEITPTSTSPRLIMLDRTGRRMNLSANCISFSSQAVGASAMPRTYTENYRVTRQAHQFDEYGGPKSTAIWNYVDGVRIGVSLTFVH